MKAILVVDIPDDLKYEDLYFDGEIRYTNDEFNSGYVFLKETGRCLLKPMPRKLQENYMLFGEEVVWQKAVGYNKCIDDILGEEE